jgi:20S proteasome alpha/beta subunit
VTLIAALCCDDAVVIASDSKGTESSTGNLLVDPSYTVKKLFGLGNSMVWGASGSGGVTLRAEADFEKDYKTSSGSYKKSVAEVEARCRTVLGSFMKKELAALTVPLVVAIQLNTPPVRQQFLFAGVCEEKPWLTEILWDGQMTSYAETRGFHAIGSGGLAALTTYNLLQHHRAASGSSIGAARATLYRIVDVCIKSNSAGLGPPIQLWEVTKSGTREIAQNELEAISDTIGLWEDAERESLSNLLKSNASSGSA